MRGLSFAGSRSKLGSSMAVRKRRAWLLACARARAACVPRLGTLSPCTVAHNTHKRKVRDIHTVAAQALCLWLRDAPETDLRFLPEVREGIVRLGTVSIF